MIRNRRLPVRKSVGHHLLAMTRNLRWSKLRSRDAIIVTPIVLFLSSCAPTVWDRPGLTQAEFNIDNAQCQLFAEQATPGTDVSITPTGNRKRDVVDSAAAGILAGISSAVAIKHNYDLCMQSRGYVTVAAGTAQVPAATAGGTAAPLPSGGEIASKVGGAVAAAKDAAKRARDEQQKAIAASERARGKLVPTEGLAEVHYPSGAFYLGEVNAVRVLFAEKGERNGYGILVYKGGRDEGQWLHEKPVGVGVITSDKGEKYEGEFRDGRGAGYGAYTWPDGRHYEGEFDKDVINGVGVLTDAAGVAQAGRWSNGRLIRAADAAAP